MKTVLLSISLIALFCLHMNGQQITHQKSFFGANYYLTESGEDLSRKEAKNLMIKTDNQKFNDRVEANYTWGEVGRYASNLGMLSFFGGLTANSVGLIEYPGWFILASGVVAVIALPIKWINLNQFKKNINQYNDIQKSKVSLNFEAGTNGAGLVLRF